MKTIPMLLAVLLFAACNSQPAAEKKQTASVPAPIEAPFVDPQFRAFLSKFRVLQLPLTIKEIDLTDSARPHLSGSDTNYIEAINSGKEGLFAYGLLPDTANSYKVIWLAPADMYYPVLATYTKNGNKIKEDGIGVGGCGSDCCFECNETVTVKKDGSMYAADSIKECNCDENGPKLETMRKYVRYKTGQIASDGKFTVSEILEKNQ
jgi:hypothetical protein